MKLHAVKRSPSLNGGAQRQRPAPLDQLDPTAGCGGSGHASPGTLSTTPMQSEAHRILMREPEYRSA